MLTAIQHPFTSVWPFYTYIGHFITIWGPFPFVTPRSDGLE